VLQKQYAKPVVQEKFDSNQVSMAMQMKNNANKEEDVSDLSKFAVQRENTDQVTIVN
jgi:hypothetical protein